MIIKDDNNIETIYLGDKQVTEIYRGNSVIYPPPKEVITLRWSSNNLSMPWNSMKDAPTFSISNEDARQYVTFKSSDESIATVTVDGVITLTGTVGNCVVTAELKDNSKYSASSVNTTLYVNKVYPDLSWNISDLLLDLNTDPANLNTLSLNNPLNLTISSYTVTSYTGDILDIVSDGNNNIGKLLYKGGTGKANIRATSLATDLYYSTSAIVSVHIDKFINILYDTAKDEAFTDDELKSYLKGYVYHNYDRSKTIDKGLLKLPPANSISDFRFSKITRLTVKYAPLVTKIPDALLSPSTEIIEHLDLSGLGKITNIGDQFLWGASSTLKLILPDLTSLETIGSYFLYKASVPLDLKLFSSVKRIGWAFLAFYSFSSLPDFKWLSNLERISSEFCWAATWKNGPVNIDLSPLTKVTSIDCGSFLHGDSTWDSDTIYAQGINTLDMSTLVNLSILEDLAYYTIPLNYRKVNKIILPASPLHPDIFQNFLTSIKKGSYNQNITVEYK